MSHGVQPNLNDVCNHGTSEFLNYNIPIRTDLQWTQEIDKKLCGDASLVCKICMVLRNYDGNRPILTITSTVHRPI